MKHAYATLIMLVLVMSLCAQTSYHDLPVAATDEVLAPMVNPAALDVGNASGFGSLTTYGEDAFKKQYSLLFNLDGLAYVYERDNGRSFHRIASGGEAFRNLYFGSAWDWKERSFHLGEYSASTLWRPCNRLSLGAVATFHRGDEGQVYRGGVGIRPLEGLIAGGHRLTLTTDIEYYNNDLDDPDYEEFGDPIFGLQVEPINGVRLGGTYDARSETYGANIRLAFDRSASGANVYTDADNEYSHTMMYSHFSMKPYNTPIIKFGRKRFYEMKLKGNLVDRRSFMRLGPFKLMRQNQIDMFALIRKIRTLQQDPAVDGILLKNPRIGGSVAEFQELADAFNDFRAAGKEVVYYFDNIGNMGYAFAVYTGDAVYLNPQGGVELRGLSVSMPFVGELLDSLGVEIVNLQSHETKTAFNFLSESKMPDSERESYELVFGDVYQCMLEMIEEGRGDILDKSAAELVNAGPYMTMESIENAKLVDGFIYEDQLEDTLEQRYGKICTSDEYTWEHQSLEWSKPRAPRVAVIYASGNIHMGKNDPGSSIGSVTLSRAIRQAREDASVKGIILRVDSGGGSAQASDIITREVLLTTGDGEITKPVVVSMGGMAASGGYYIAAYADHIIAEPGTITGSIGVTGMLPNLAGLLRKVRVNWETVRFGDHADIASIWRSPTEVEREMFIESIEEHYGEFIAHVAKGRGMTVEEVDPIAQGRIWTGRQALARGLVDELGGMDTAQDWMKNRLKVEHLTLVEFTGEEDKFGIPVEAEIPRGPFGLAIMPEEADEFIEVMEELIHYDGERILYRCPIGAAPEFE